MNERTIFLNALELPSPEARAEYLDATCAGDSGLRERVDKLLKAHEQEHGLVDVLAGSTDEQTSSMVPADQGAPNEPAGEREDLSFLGTCATPGCIGSLGSYEIIEVIGRGGMGVVLKARDPKLQRIVAIKVLAPEIAANKTAKKRFEREAQAAAAVSHDHIVTIHAVDEFNGLPFIVMECIVGRTLQEKIEETGPLELKEILRIGMQAALGLAAAHKQGLVHRDIKPANILLQNGIQRVKITDFGLARATDDVGMTHTGQIAGTPMYMSPEQAQGQKVDHLSDLFSLGSVLYTMCTGRPAFRAPNTVAVLRRVCDAEPRPILEVNSELPEWLVAIVNKLLSKKKEDRYQTAAEVAELLSDHLSRLQEPRTGQTVAPSTASVTPVAHATDGSPSPVVPGGTIPPRTPRLNWLLASSGAAVMVTFSIMIITITSKKGRMTEIEVPGDSKIENTTINDSRVAGGGNPANATGWHGWPADAPKPAIAPFDAEQANQHQEAWAKYLGVPVEYTNTTDMNFRLIPPGEFMMGSTQAEIEVALKDAHPNDQHWQRWIKSENPQHRVILTRPFYLGATEVTQRVYESVMGKNPSHFSHKTTQVGNGADATTLPVDSVSWNDAAEFCAVLSQRDNMQPFYRRNGESVTLLKGNGYRLPSEAEWEYSCRAGTTTTFWNGNTAVGASNVGWFDSNSGGRTHVVGELAANPFGLFDVHGNVFEWCQDWLDTSHERRFTTDPALDPSGPAIPFDMRVLRGGDWGRTVSHSRSSNRSGCETATHNSPPGLRVVLPVESVRALREKPVKTTRHDPVAGAKQKLAFETPEFEAWSREVALMPIVKQVEAVKKKLVELNPSFDGNVAPDYGNDAVTGLEFRTDNVMDISPVRALVGLRSLRCPGAWRNTVFEDLSPLKGMLLTELNIEGTRVSDLTPLKDMKLEVLRCGYTQISNLSPVKEMKLTELNCWHTAVSDLSPLNPAKLTTLEFNGTAVPDLTALRGFKLKSLSFAATKISDLTPLQEMQLEGLDCGMTAVSDLAPLKNMKLKYLSCGITRVSSLLPLEDSELTSLICADTQVSDLSPLKGKKLTSLYCGNTLINDLTPLQDMPFNEFHCQGAKVTDYSPLKGSSMTRLSLDFKPDRDTELLHTMKKLVWINGKSAAEFWKDVEGQRSGEEIR